MLSGGNTGWSRRLAEACFDQPADFTHVGATGHLGLEYTHDLSHVLHRGGTGAGDGFFDDVIFQDAFNNKPNKPKSSFFSSSSSSSSSSSGGRTVSKSCTTTSKLNAQGQMVESTQCKIVQT